MPTRPPPPLPPDAIEAVAKIMEHRRESGPASVPIVMPKPEVKALFVGPLVLDTVLHRKATQWEERLAAEYGVEVDMHVADPPFQTDDIECKGYWLKPDARTYEQRVKKLKSQVSSALIVLLTEIERVRPRIIVGEGQGGVVAAMSTFPVVLERACRDREVTQHQMQTFRRAWSGITSILIIDPTILPTSNNLKSIPFEGVWGDARILSADYSCTILVSYQLNQEAISSAPFAKRKSSWKKNTMSWRSPVRISRIGMRPR